MGQDPIGGLMAVVVLVVLQTLVDIHNNNTINNNNRPLDALARVGLARQSNEPLLGLGSSGISSSNSVSYTHLTLPTN